jgi:hypothetical protein
MKSPIEISQQLFALGWTLYRLEQKTGETETNINYAIHHPEERDTREKIAAAVGVPYEELFGE